MQADCQSRNVALTCFEGFGPNDFHASKLDGLSLGGTF